MSRPRRCLTTGRAFTLVRMPAAAGVAKLEYLYINFGDGPTVPVGTAFVGASGKLTDNIVRVGVNYKSF